MLNIGTMILYISLFLIWTSLVSYLFIEDNLVLAILVYVIGVLGLCTTLSEVLGVLLD